MFRHCVSVCRSTSERQHIHVVSTQSADGVLPHRQHRRRPRLVVGPVSLRRRQVYC